MEALWNVFNPLAMPGSWIWGIAGVLFLIGKWFQSRPDSPDHVPNEDYDHVSRE